MNWMNARPTSEWRSPCPGTLSTKTAPGYLSVRLWDNEVCGLVLSSPLDYILFYYSYYSEERKAYRENEPCCCSAWSLVLFPAGGFPFELTEGDIICVFSQYVSCSPTEIKSADTALWCHCLSKKPPREFTFLLSPPPVRYGEIVNINLVRDKKTGKSKGFCFICYEDQRSTVLAVDNFNGIKVTNAASPLTQTETTGWNCDCVVDCFHLHAVLSSC